jgi:hypothetical protein
MKRKIHDVYVRMTDSLSVASTIVLLFYCNSSVDESVSNSTDGRRSSIRHSCYHSGVKIHNRRRQFIDSVSAAGRQHPAQTVDHQVLD